MNLFSYFLKTSRPPWSSQRCGLANWSLIREVLVLLHSLRAKEEDITPILGPVHSVTCISLSWFRRSLNMENIFPCSWPTAPSKLLNPITRNLNLLISRYDASGSTIFLSQISKYVVVSSGQPIMALSFIMRLGLESIWKLHLFKVLPVSRRRLERLLMSMILLSIMLARL